MMSYLRRNQRSPVQVESSCGVVNSCSYEEKRDVVSVRDSYRTRELDYVELYDPAAI